MKRVSLNTEAHLCFNDSVGVLANINYLAHIKYTYFKQSVYKEEPDFEVKSIHITFDGMEDSPFVKAEGELFYSIIENDSVVNAIYDGIREYEDEMYDRYEDSLDKK